MEIRFDGKRALVTGAGQGIGRAIAKKLVACGATTVALSRTQSDLDSLKQEIPSIETVQCDLADWDATRKAVIDLGPIDLLVNNAGTDVFGPFLNLTKEDVRSAFAVNFDAAFNVTQVVAKGMVARQSGGSVVNICSVTTMAGADTNALYSSAKGALDTLTRVLAIELGKKQIRVNAVHPTNTNSPRTIQYWNSFPDKKYMEDVQTRQMGKFFADMEDVANTVVFLLSDKSAMTNGISMPIDGGFTVC